MIFRSAPSWFLEADLICKSWFHDWTNIITVSSNHHMPKPQWDPLNLNLKSLWTWRIWRGKHTIWMDDVYALITPTCMNWQRTRSTVYGSRALNPKYCMPWVLWSLLHAHTSLHARKLQNSMHCKVNSRAFTEWNKVNAQWAQTYRKFCDLNRVWIYKPCLFNLMAWTNRAETRQHY